MSKTISFRSVVQNKDLENVRRIVTSSGFFQEHEVPVAVELVQEHLDKGIGSGYHFIFAQEEDYAIAYACFGEIPCTKGSWDLYWIATDADFRRRGIGKMLLAEMERQVLELGGRAIYIETSSKPHYEPTRLFYKQAGYSEVAVLNDFYDTNDHKHIFSKRITTA